MRTQAYLAEKMWLKAAAREIRQLKLERKPSYTRPENAQADPILGKRQIRYKSRKTYDGPVEEIVREYDWVLFSLSWEYRKRHIAYSIVRGRTLAQIEPGANKDQQPKPEEIQEYVDRFQAAINAEIAASAPQEVTE